MASITSNGTVIVRVAAGLYGLAPGNSIYSELVNASYSGGVNALVNNLYTSDFGASTTKAVAEAMVANLGITGDAASGAANFVEGQLTATAASARGAKVVEMLNLFAGLTADATYGAAATAWNTKVTNAVTTAQTAGSSDAAFTTVSSALIGKAFALTAGIDASVGTAGNDTFSGTQDTTNSTDSIDGGAGSDTFVYTTTGAGIALSAGVKNVETLTVTLTGDKSSAFDVKSATGYTTVSVLNTAFNAQVSNVAKAAKVVLENFTGNKTATIGYLASDLTGSTDSVTLELNRVGSSAQGVTISAADAGIETQVINSTGSATNYIASATLSDSTKTLTITGDQKVTITDLVISAPALKTVDASANTAGVSIDLVVGTARDLSVTGGAGNDTFTFGGTLTIDDTVNGGDGTDTVSVNAAVGTTVTLTSIEAVTYTGTATHSASQANLSNIKTVNNGAASTVTITNGASNGIALVSAYDGAGFAYSLKTGTDGTADSVSLQTGLATSTAKVDTTVKTNNIETLNLNNVTKTAGTVNTLTVTAADSGSTSLTKVVITGNADTTIADGGGFASELVVDGTASTGALTYNGVASVAETVLGGVGNDAFVFAASEFTTDDSINGGEGNDTLTLTAVASGSDNAFGRIYATGIENIKIDAIDQDQTTSIDFRGATGLATVTATIADIGTGATTFDNLPATVTKFTLIADETNTADTTAAGNVTIDTDGGSSLTIVLNSDDDSTYDTQFGASGARELFTLTGTATTYAMTQDGTGGDADYLTLTANTATSLSMSTASRAVDIDVLSANKLTTLTVSGSNAFTVSAASVSTGSKLTTVDAASATGAVTLGSGTTYFERAAAATITTGGGDDTIQFGVGSDAGNTIAAGLNATVTSSNNGDLLKLTGLITGETTINLSVSADQIVTVNGVANSAAQTGFDSVDASSVTSTGAGVYVVGTTGANNLTGSSGNDTLDGGSGNDIIVGGSGNDVITAGAGVDAVTGGAGNDTIDLTESVSSIDTVNFSNLNTNGVDTIIGFKQGTDLLNLELLGGGNVAGELGIVANDSAATDLTTAYIAVFANGADGTGSTAITDYTDMSQIVTFLAGNLVEAATEKYVAVINDLVTSKAYIFNIVVDTVINSAGVIESGDVTLVGVVTTDAAITVASTVFTA